MTRTSWNGCARPPGERSPTVPRRRPSSYLRRALREPPSAQARPAVLAELGHAEATAGRAEAIAHLEAAIALVDHAPERARLLLEFGRALHHSGRLTEACAAFRRGLDELDAGRRSRRRAAGGAGGRLSERGAVRARPRCVTSTRRATEILAGADTLTTAAELTLLSKAIMMRAVGGRTTRRGHEPRHAACSATGG